jgi:Iron-containing redox enzyme
MPLSALKASIETSCDQLRSTTVLRKLDEGRLTLSEYHETLKKLFFQVLHSSSSFSLAASHCKTSEFEAKSYLMRHAEEEKDHWKWILSDLANTGYAWENPHSTPPESSTAGYVGFNYFIAQTDPIGRLAIAATLESFGAKFGAWSARKLCSNLGLSKNQVVFFGGHGDTDVGHTAEILDVLSRTEISEKRQQELVSISKNASALYCRMYQ